MRITLVADVPDYPIARCIENRVQRDGQLDDAESGPDMPTGPRADLDQAHAHLFRHRAQLVARHRLQIRWGVDTLEDGHLEPDSGGPCYNEISDFRQLLRQQSACLQTIQAIVNQSLRATLSAVDAEQRRVCALTEYCVATGSLAECAGSRRDVENVVHDLEREADVSSKSLERVQLACV